MALESAPLWIDIRTCHFERLMERVLKGLQWRTLLLYLDDIIVFWKDFDSHLAHLEEVFQRFRAAQLKLKPS